MMKWISEVWNDLDEQTIIDSFPACGILFKDEHEYNRHLYNIIIHKELPLPNIVEIATEDDIQRKNFSEHSVERFLHIFKINKPMRTT